MKKLFIITGELSGSIHAANVVREIKKLYPDDVEIEAIGSKELEEAGAKLFSDHKKMNVIGFNPKIIWEHLTLGAKLIKYLKTEFKPDLVLLVDYGGFNLNMAKMLKRNKIKNFHFIPPQVWASRKWRINTIKRNVDKVLTIFPFEGAIYSQAGIDYEYVGHPLAMTIPQKADKATVFKKYGLDEAKRLVAIFPGSREFELKFLAKTFLGAKQIIEQKVDDVQFVVSQASNLSDAVFEQYIPKDTNIKVVKGDNHALLSTADALILASGTVALEAALYQTPMLISYRGPLPLYLLYKLVRSIDKASLPNIITGKNLIREFLQGDSTPEFISNEIVNILSDSEYETAMRDSLGWVGKLLTTKDACKNVANIVLTELVSS